MSDATESPWTKELAAALEGPDVEERAHAFSERASPGYRDLTGPAEAALDLAVLEAMVQDPPAEEADAEPDSAPADLGVFGGAHRLVVRDSTDPGISFRLRRFGPSGIELTRLLPVLESFGLVVVEVVPLRIKPVGDGKPGIHIDDIAVRTDSPHGPEALRFVPEVHGPRLVEALEVLARGDADVDSLNRLVTVAGLDWRQVMMLRAYARYRLQYDRTRSWDELVDPLAAFPEVARSLVGYFQARFDPSIAESERDPSAQRYLCIRELDLVPHLEQDRVLRGYLALVDATLRTNYFQVDHRNVVLKLDSRQVPDLPVPRPLVEAWVHGPQVEGIHLRAGLIARGGLRSSDRPGDFRTEVLDLAFAQVKKNAIIVPTGAKGGFVTRGTAPAGREAATPQRVATTPAAAYEEFVSGLLQITDNIVEGRVVAPPDLIAADGSDPYLVVAADKGTATFSDLANSISERAGFWLGDAFASGGSRGYDHKAMGITARGAWVGVRRHFRELGIDVQVDPVRVVGVGDMSGDVFGNGMLQSRAIRLVAAFDHRHVFLDPEPDAEVAYEERARVSALPRSSWADYQHEALSEGGGVWPRDEKSIDLAPSVRRVLGIDVPSLSPPALISAILSAPVDLIWFGGIGTFIKATSESDADVGDRTNDGVRITADKVRARVISEGANLAVTQLARIRYSRRGGRINADFIDNAAGVATSDREVNLKVLLSLAIEEGRIKAEERDRYLTEAASEVADEVLRQVDHSVAALNRATVGSAQELDAYESLLEALEEAGRFDREVEVLPSREEMEVRRAAGAGLIRPELAVLLAYAKSDLVARIEESPSVSDPGYLDAVVPYFPKAIRDDFHDLIPRHRLYPQLVATDVAGEIVDHLGIVWAHETAEELGRRVDEVAGAFWAARTVTGAGVAWSQLEAAADSVAAETEARLHSAIARTVADLARSYLVSAGPVDIGAITKRDRDLAIDLASRAGVAHDLVDLSAPSEIVADVSKVCAAGRVSDVGPVASATGRPPSDVSEVLNAIDPVCGLEGLGASIRRAMDTSPPPGRLTVWQARALLDDIAAWRRAAATDILAASSTVPAWAERNQEALASAAALSGSADVLAAASLTLRRLSRTMEAG